MRDINLTVREIDDLLERFYNRLKGKKEGLSLAEPAAILLSYLKKYASQSYLLYAPGFFPVIIDVLTTEAFASFGCEGLESLLDVASDIPVISDDYTPGIVEDNLGRIRKTLERISAVLGGNDPGDRTLPADGEKDEPAKTGFFREDVRGSVGLPLISNYTSGKALFTTSRIFRINAELRITGELNIRKKLDPVVTFDHMLPEHNSRLKKQILTAVRLAENFVASTMHMKSIFRIPRQYTISLPDTLFLPCPVAGMMTDDPAGLAITTLLISLLGKLDLSSRKYRVRAGSAFTGTIDDTGRIFPVEEPCISENVRSVFYSIYDRLVVPARNLETAENEFSRLARKHPDRKLEIIPASKITEICADTRVMEIRRTPAGKMILQRIFHSRKHLIAGISAVAAALIYFLFLSPYLDKTVARVRMVDSLLVMTNRNGNKVNTYNTGFTLVKENQKIYQRYYIDDFNGDGKNEIACLLSESRMPKSKPGLYNRLHFLVFDHRGDLMQKYIYNDEKIMGEEIGEWGINQSLSMQNINILPDSTGWGVFYISTNHISYPPSAIIRFSLKSNSCQMFFHKGILRNMTIKDFDKDGNPDIVLLGYNIELGSAVMIVLDPRYINGSSPEGHNYSVDGYDTDIAKYYIRFPEFRLYKYYAKKTMRLFVSLHEDTNGFSILVKSMQEDVRFFFSDNVKCTKTDIVNCYFKGYAKPDSIVAIADYNGKEQDKKRLLEGIRYWDGGKWVDEPVMNNSYLKFINNSLGGRTGSGPE